MVTSVRAPSLHYRSHIVILCYVRSFVDERLAVMSIGFMLENPDQAIIWRGPRKNGVVFSLLLSTCSTAIALVFVLVSRLLETDRCVFVQA